MVSPVAYDELSELAYKYGTDKCPRIFHPYTPFYYELLKDRKNTIKKVLEVGIGYYEMLKYGDQSVWDKNLGRQYMLGASLKMWRDFFPNAQVYGADIRKEVMFGDERIKTFLCDETKKEDIEQLIKNTGKDIDLFVDDGSHHWEYQIFLCLTAMPLLQKEVIYVIEDIDIELSSIRF